MLHSVVIAWWLCSLCGTVGYWLAADIFIHLCNCSLKGMRLPQSIPCAFFWEDFCNYILNLLTYFTFQKLLNLISFWGTALELFFPAEDEAQMCTANQSLHYFSNEFAVWLLFPHDFSYVNKYIIGQGIHQICLKKQIPFNHKLHEE